jgi:hypothetical protein
MADQNEMRGVLFRNEKKSEGSNQPDYRGTAQLHGVRYKLSAWIKSGKSDGKKFMSIPIQEDGGAQQSQQSRRDYQKPPAGGDSRGGSTRRQQEVDDEVPF